MSIFDRIFMGKVIKDFATLEEKSFIIGKTRKSMLLTERRGKLKIVFKTRPLHGTSILQVFIGIIPGRVGSPPDETLYFF